MYDYEEYMPKILETHAYIWGDDVVPKKIDAGFTNVVFDMGKAILKICVDPENEPNFQREGEFLMFHGGTYRFAPRLFSFSSTRVTAPFYYEILEKINGSSLYSQWPDLKKRDRRYVIDTIADIIESLHNMRGGKIDWCEKCKSRILSALKNTENEFSADEQELIRKAADRCEDIFGHEERSVFVHNDMHFDNFLYDRGVLKLIDYERSCYAPEDFELDILLRMLRDPKKYANEADEERADTEDYSEIRKRLEKRCKNLFAVPELEKRLAAYDIAYQLENLEKAPQYPELRANALASAGILL